MGNPDPDWLGDLTWRGAPALEPRRDFSAIPADAPAAPPRERPVPQDPRLGEAARENEALRARLEQLTRLASDFENRLSEAGIAYETALLELESRLRDAGLERERRADAERALHEAKRKLAELVEDNGRLSAAAAEQAGALTELRRQTASQNERMLQTKVLTDQDVSLLRQELRDFLAYIHRIAESSGEKP